MADIYGAVTDAGVNRAIRFMMVNWPFLFNHVAPVEVSHKDEQTGLWHPETRWLVCHPVHLADHVHVPRYSRRPALRSSRVPMPGIPYCIQITDLQVDFHPSDQIQLARQLDPPLNTQQFAIRVKASFGLACPPEKVIENLIVNKLELGVDYGDQFNSQVMDVDHLICFYLELQAVGHLYRAMRPGDDPAKPPITQIRVEMDDLEIINISPISLESALECYISMAIRAWLLPELVLALEPIFVNLIGLTVTPSLPLIEPNPAIEHNELRVWLDIAFH